MTYNNSYLNWADSTGQPLRRMPQVIRPGTDAVIFDDGGRILLQQRMDNEYWALPGGAVEIGESVEQSVKREVLEETGLVVVIKRLVGIYSDPNCYAILSYPSGDVVHYVSIAFECQVTAGEIAISSESKAVRYFPPSDLPHNTLRAHKIRVEDALLRHSHPFIG